MFFFCSKKDFRGNGASGLVFHITRYTNIKEYLSARVTQKNDNTTHQVYLNNSLGSQGEQ